MRGITNSCHTSTNLIWNWCKAWIKFQRSQFLFVLFVMTINKSYFKRWVEYVKKKKRLMITNDECENTNVTSNVVFIVFRNV